MAAGELVTRSSMAAASASAIACLLFLGFLPSLATAVSFSYSTFSNGTKNITLQGSAAIAGDGWIEITTGSNLPSGGTMGRVAYSPPVQLWDAATGEVASFTTRFSFNITPTNLDNKGDGMAFFLVGYPSRMPDTADGGALGLTSRTFDAVMSGDNRFVAVEFDTFNNSFDPNATYDHIGIDVNSIVSVQTESLPSFSLTGNMAAIVDYNGSSSILSAQLVKTWTNGSTTLYNLSTTVDLKTALPEKVSVGFSAATGSSLELHQLHSWYFNSSFQQNPPPAAQPSPTTSGPGLAGVIAGATAGGALFVVLLFAMIVVLVRRRRSKKRMEAEEAEEARHVGLAGDDDDDDDGEPIVEIEMGMGPRQIPYHELVEATKSFAAEEKLGQGGFGAVYRGYLREQGLAVAIKRFAKDSSKQGKKEYRSEIKVISRLRHRNLVQLIGWCHGRDELLLVYELVPNRSLDIHLHGNGTFLTWPMRVKIVLGLGSALFYLHEEWEQCVVHRDIKPSNVMLDESFNAKLGDFGLARFIDHAVGMQTMTAVSGTPGYVDPECVITGRASSESDVYSFGIVLLEVACGRRPMSLQDNQKNGIFRLVEWVWDLHGQGDVISAADERLNGDYDVSEMERVITVGLWCAHPDPSARPSIRAAMAMLQSSGQLPVLPAKMPVPTYAPPVASVEGLFTSSTGMSSSSATQSSSTTSGYITHTSSSSNTSTSAAGQADRSVLVVSLSPLRADRSTPAAMAGVSLISCAVGIIFFSAVCYLPTAPIAALTFNYTNFNSNNPSIEYEGNASFSVGYIDISLNEANGMGNSAGRVSYKQPVQLWEWDAATGEVASFTTTFSFNITPSDRNNRGDGMAFFLGSYPSRLPDRAGGHNLGLTNQTIGNVSTGDDRFVAVEFDTYVNYFDPNATYDHIGIDVNSIVSVTNESLPNFSLIGNMTSTVDYNNNSRTLSVKLWINETTTPYTLSSMVDLRRALPENVTVGFSASTGIAYEKHQLTSWREAEDEENASTDSDNGEPITEIEVGTGPRRLPYYELVEATKNFAAEEKLRQGGFGSVYRGYLREQGHAVAIKRFAKDSSKQGKKECKSEIKVISRLCHRNLVQLVGWCHGRNELLLVYELVPNRSLDVHLHGNGTFLTWPMRIKIVLGLGSALLYLHQEWEQCVVHHDIKPSNVMLDESFNAKLGDFGLARLIDHTIGIKTMTAMSGTLGYLDPECVITGRASAESDVYSFGIVLLEVACGRRPMSLLDSHNNGVFRLVEWAWVLYGKGDVLMAADERLNGDYDSAEMERVITLGLWCAHPDPSARPSTEMP
uniref:non-specific serine/threonine protein kinase n=1 Tax=Oryza barthii TaxID=65489 RepID=A0A0D3GVX5_9ORYZ